MSFLPRQMAEGSASCCRIIIYFCFSLQYYEMFFNPPPLDRMIRHLCSVLRGDIIYQLGTSTKSISMAEFYGVLKCPDMDLYMYSSLTFPRALVLKSRCKKERIKARHTAGYLKQLRIHFYASRVLYCLWKCVRVGAFPCIGGSPCGLMAMWCVSVVTVCAQRSSSKRLPCTGRSATLGIPFLQDQ